MTGQTRRYGHSAAVPNARSVGVHPVMPHARGMQPPPNDPNKLRKTLYRIALDIRLLLGRRAPLVIQLDRIDQQLAQLRHAHVEYGAAFEGIDPEGFARAQQDLRELDDPIMVLRWAQRGDLDRGDS